MSRASILIVIGVLAILAPFSGLPGAARTLFAIVLGCVVIVIGVAERSREQRRLIALQSASPAPAPAPAPLPPVVDMPAVSLPPPPPPPPPPAPAPSTPVAQMPPEAEGAAAQALPPRKPRARKSAPKTMSPI